MKHETLSAKDALIQASEMVGSRGALASLLGIPRASVNYGISNDTVSPGVAVKLDILVENFRADVYLPHIFTSEMMTAERACYTA